MSYRSYVPWARSYLNEKYNKNKPASEQPTNKEQQQFEQDKEDKDKKDKDKREKDTSRYSSRYGNSSATRTPEISISSSLNSYRPGNYRPTPTLPPSSYVAPRARERSSSRERYTTTYLPKETRTPSEPYARPTYSRSNSTLSESEAPEKKSSASSYRKYGTSPSRTISYTKSEDKVTPITPKTESVALKYTTNPYTSRFLAAVGDKGQEENRYTYRTRPQPVLKNLEISIPKSETSSPLSPLSPSSRSPLSPLSPKYPSSPVKLPTSPVKSDDEDDTDLPRNIPCTISVVNRGTSPNQPTSYSRSRRSEIAREIQRDVARPRKRPESRDQETQTEKVEESSRFSRFGTRSTPWSSYLDRFSSSSYTPSVSRYSRYPNEPPRSSRSAKTDPVVEPSIPKSATTESTSDKLKSNISSIVTTLKTTPLPAPQNSPPKQEKQTSYSRIEPRAVEKQKSSLTERRKSSLSDTSNALSNSRDRNKIASTTKQKTPSPEKLIVSSTEKLKSVSPEKVKAKSPEKNKTESKISPSRFANSIADKIRGIKTKSPEKVVKSSSKNNLPKQSSQDKLTKSNSPEKVGKPATSVTTEKVINTKSSDKVNEQLTKPKKNENTEKHFSPEKVDDEVISLQSEAASTNSSSSEKITNLKSPENTLNLSMKEKFVKSQSPESSSKGSISEKKIKSSSPEKIIKVSSPEKLRRSDSSKIITCQSPEPSKLPKMPSKPNLVRRHTSKEETPEPFLASTETIKNSNIVPLIENKPNIEQKVDIISQSEKKTDSILKPNTDNVPPTSQKNTTEINELIVDEKIIKNASETSLVAKEKSSSENVQLNVSSNTSLLKEIPGRLTPRRSISREEPIILENTNMSTDLIVGPMKIEAPRNRVQSPREILEVTVSNNNVAATIGNSSIYDCHEETNSNSTASDALASTILPVEKSPSINRKPPPSPKLVSKAEKLPQQSSKLKQLKTSTSQNAIPIIKVANKDFRKSPLNMSTGEMKDVTKIEVAMTKRAFSEGSSPLCPRKPLKSLSKISLDESSVSESNEENIKISPDKAQKISMSRSSSQLRSNSSSNANILENTESSSDLSFKSSSGDLLKNKDVSVPIVVETIQHPGSCTQFIRHSRSIRRDSSSSLSSSSDTSSEEESDDDSVDSDQLKPQNNELCAKVSANNVPSNKYPVEVSAASTSEDVSSLSIDKTTEKTSKASTDKPPLPPNARAKDDNKPTSFLMRALAPVTNFLWVNKKQDSIEKSPTNISVADDSNIKRSNTSQSISEIHDHLESLDISNKSDIDIDNKLSNNTDHDNHGIIKCTDITATPMALKTQNSKDIAMWLDAEEKIITDNLLKNFSKSSENITSENIERNLSFRSLPGRKSRPVSCEIGWWLKDEENDKPLPDQIETIENACVDPDEKEEQKSPIIFRSPSGEHEFSLNGAGDISEYSSSSEETESSDSEEEFLEPKAPIRINFKRVESGERAWWLQSTDNVPEGILRMKSTTSLHKEDKIVELQSTQEQIQNTDNISDGIKREPSSASLSEGSKGARRFKLRHIESGEKAWWMESSENIHAGIQKDPSTPSMSTTTTEEDQGAIRYRIRPQQSDERAWWMQSTENIPDGIKRNESSKSISKSSLSSQSRKLRRIDSSDKPWWANSQDNVALNEGLKRNDSMRVGKPPDGLKRSGSTRSTDSRPRRIRHIESGERAWWMDSTDNVPEGITKLEPDSPPNETESKLLTNKLQSQASGDRTWWFKSTDNVPEAQTRLENELSVQEVEPKRRWHNLRPQQSGERPWWLDSNANIPDGITQLTPSTSESESTESESDQEEDEIPVSTAVPKFPLELGARTSPDGLEGYNTRASGRESPYDNVSWLGAGEEEATPRVKKKMHLFIGSHTNIDEILGAGEAPAEQTPIDVAVKELAEKFQVKVKSQEIEESSSEEEDENELDQQEKPAAETTPRRRRSRATEEPEEPTSVPQEAAGLEPGTGEKLDDVALQLYKDGDYGSYLDLEASLSEQQEEFEDFHLNRKNSIVLRTQLSVRVHTIIEKLLKSEGRELRRALFSLKQIFQEDKDLVHEFVQNDGLACLIKVGSEADQNYQNYILRALGQVMLYVDGMNGVMAHNETVQWLYALISSRFRLVVKTALKLLLVFVEYKESNCMLLIKAIKAEDTAKNQSPWSNVMRLLSDYDTSDTELLVYASSLVNKTLNGIPDQDTYYDQADALEEQGMEGIIQRYMSRQGTDLDLLRQFQIYEAVLHHEDGEEKGTPVKLLDETIRKTLRNRKSSSSVDSPNERRKSRRHASLTSPTKNGLSNGSGPHLICSPIKQQQQQQQEDDEGSSSSRSSPSPSLVGEMRHLNGGSYADNNKANVGVTPALRRRRERTERQRNFIREQQETAAILRKSSSGDIVVEDDKNNVDAENRQPPSRTPSRQDILMNAVNSDLDAKDGGTDERSKILQLNRENTVKDLTQKLANSMLSPTNEQNNRSIGDMTGIISKAMEGLAKSKSKGDLKPTEKIVPEIKKSETDIQWENLLENMQRPLTLCDLDFTDLHSDDEMDILAPNFVANGIPPPPPPLNSVPPPPSGTPYAPPPPPSRFSTPPAPPGAFGVNLKHFSQYPTESPASQEEKSVKKSKKTLKLFWKEVREDPAILSKLQKLGQNLIWDELSPVSVDTQKLEHLFESRAKDINPKTKQEMNKTKEVIVLDPKRSNAINIGMTKLPPPRAIKTAILKMDSTVMNREGIEKLFAMLPTEEERSRIQEAQVANPDIPLGSAEQFLLTMASITELPARLKLWAFKLDYENIEKEIAEPVMDLKQGMEILKSNRTFRCILGTLLSIGIFLNGNEVKGFQIEYLAKVPEVKDTVHKHSLLHHLCHMVMEKFPESTDLYSEIGAVTRASKVDFDELANNINRLENECKASWDHLKVIAKHDGASVTKNKMSEFLTDCAQRIIVLSIVHRRIMNRFHKFLLWLGTPPHRIQDTKPNEFCRIVSEFALEYRTTRERVLQQLEKKANHRERNKTRGKMITEVGKFRSKETDRADAELRQLLGGDMSETESLHGTWRRQRKDLGRLNSLLRDEHLSEHLPDGDDEILESLVKTATKTPVARTTPRERKRTRHADRKSLRRTLKNGLSEEEKKHLAAYIKGY